MGRQYNFPIQVGDRQRTYDGLLGFWKTKTPSSQDAPLLPVSQAENFNYDEIFTFWADNNCKNTTPIKSSNYVQLPPFYIPPLDDQGTFVSPEKQATQRNLKLTIISALIDPFTSIHTFSGTLPIASVTLPLWSTEAALKRMTTFFHMGPILLTSDVPPFNKDFLLTPDNYDLARNTAVPGNIGNPSLKPGQWRWLQPYTSQDKSAEPPFSKPEGEGEADTAEKTPDDSTLPAPPN